ncbi:ABC transporter permease [Micropruina glycogenica]|uniref:Inner membrane transport permease YbhR (Modular protein) n=1 Tax=Micropruina glycogenica TaxID=75385 RepID=A0A2N9JKN4_9ACTN|nr:ABC transporter permease [Micropruina glycogenica]SPD88570.1 Inner membrane transport permease YbhR (modular protein) [Micropruina glycogenica]
MSLHRIRLLMWKEFLQLRRDPLLIRLLFLMPILQLILFGYVVAADVKNLSTAVVDLDRTSTSRALEASFGASDYFVVTQRPAETDLQHLMDTGQIAIAIVIPAGTQAALDRGEAAPIGVVVDGSDSQVASVGSGYAAQIVARFNADRLAAQGVDLAAPGIDARVRVMFNPTLASVNTMIPGLVAAILMLSIMAVMGQAVVKERERGTLEQMFVTPIKPVEYLTGKVTPYALLAVLQLTVVALVGIFWFKVPFAGQFSVVAAGLALFMLTSIGLGLLISLVSHTRQQAQQVMMLFMLPSFVLSGFIFPIDSMPQAIQPLSWFIPLTWAISILRGAFIKGSGFEALSTQFWILWLFGVVIFGAAVAATRRRLAE